MSDPAADPGMEARVRESFAAQSLMTTLGATLLEVAPGRTVIAAPLAPGVLQQQGLAHAGLTFAIGDSAAGYAALSLMGAGAEVVTTEMKIHLLAPGRGERLVAEGRVIRSGRRLTVAAADVYAEAGGARSLVATLLGTMMPTAR